MGACGRTGAGGNGGPPVLRRGITVRDSTPAAADRTPVATGRDRLHGPGGESRVLKEAMSYDRPRTCRAALPPPGSWRFPMTQARMWPVSVTLGGCGIHSPISPRSPAVPRYDGSNHNEIHPELAVPRPHEPSPARPPSTPAHMSTSCQSMGIGTGTKACGRVPKRSELAIRDVLTSTGPVKEG